MTPTTTRQMISAELLKLRRNRALMTFCLLLSVGSVVVMFGYTGLEHSSNAAANPPAGGTLGLHRAVRALGEFFGLLSAYLIGTEAGTADVSAGVFRDLVATGRSRLSLFAVRFPAAVLLTLALTAVGFVVALAGIFLLAGGSPTPSFSLLAQSAGWLVLANVVSTMLAVGIGSLTGSRPITLTGLIGWTAVATPLLLDTTSLGSVRNLLMRPALGQLMPFSGDTPLRMATGAAILVLLGWAVIPAVLGGWRTQTQDA